MIKYSDKTLDQLTDRLNKCADDPVSCGICPVGVHCVEMWDEFIVKYHRLLRGGVKKRTAREFNRRLTKLLQCKDSQVGMCRATGVIPWNLWS